MIVACPHCATRFRVPEQPARKSARLRCSRCGHAWALEAGVPSPPPADAASAPASPGPQAPARRPRRLVWGLPAAALVLVVAAVFVVARDPIAARVPFLESLYRGVGLSITVPSGLRLEDLVLQTGDDAQEPSYEISGSLHNASGSWRPLPMIRAEVQDRDGKPVHVERLAPPAPELAPDETIAFSYVIRHRTEAADRLVVTLEQAP